MSRITVGIVDYGAGNLTSVKQSLYSMGYRSRVSSDIDTLDNSDLLLVPGVGAFPSAMKALHKTELAEYIVDKSHQGKPIIGICLGMQLLMDCSHELELTSGLGLIPGEVRPLSEADWHIGWNNIETLRQRDRFKIFDGQTVYFNHSYVVHTDDEYVVAVSRINHETDPFTVAVCRNNVVGLQFHPEKSQKSGRKVLSSVIKELADA